MERYMTLIYRAILCCRLMTGTNGGCSDSMLFSISHLQVYQNIGESQSNYSYSK